MTKPHPITPPPELVQEWARYQGFESPEVLWRQIATEAARWGADQELEACLAEVSFFNTRSLADKIRITRRPKPPSLKEKALRAYWRFQNNEHTNADEMMRDFRMIEKALEALPDD